jgi:hypothetical protein
MMTIEITIPEDWTPGQALAMRALLQHAILNATPVVAFIRKDASADQLKGIYDRVEALIREAGLEAK